MGTDAISVVVVEDDPSFCDYVTILLRRSGYEVDAADVTDWLEHLARAQPDVVLLDLSLGPVDAVDRIPEVVASCPTTMVAVLTSWPAEDLEDATRRAGAFVFYEKASAPEVPEHLRHDLGLFRRALAGEDVVAPAAATRRPATSDEASAPH